MISKGVRYFVKAGCGEHISNFAKEVEEFSKRTPRDIIAKFNDVYFEVNNKMSQKDIIEKYYKILDNK